jgi:ribosomal protein S18 acetylase RimI-like enzyme
MLRLRNAGRDDGHLLRALLLEAAFWRPNAVRPPPDEELNPELARYVEDFGRPGDLGIVAEQNTESLGAAWWRYFPSSAPGYGFLDEATPELSIAVLPGHRGRGIGTALLKALESEARERGLDRLSLSVERENPAVALYKRVGFRAVQSDRDTLTMVLKLKWAPLRQNF